MKIIKRTLITCCKGKIFIWR